MRLSIWRVLYYLNLIIMCYNIEGDEDGFSK